VIQGFKEFVLRGNVIDLAVAVVIGAAFGAVVSAIVDGLFTPLIGALFNADSLSTALQVEIPTTSGGTAVLAFGAVLAAILKFVVVALVVYVVFVYPMNRVRARAAAKAAATTEPEASGPSETELLTEIRDLLAKR